jgi:ribosomal protein S18 acetylase RimI-like enzyme
VEPLSGTFQVGPASSGDAQELATVAALTFPLACPPSVTADNIAAFIDANLSANRFADYLDDPDRAVVVARQDDLIVGYAMLVRGPDDTAELSKMYVLPQRHASGAAAALMERALSIAADWGVHRVWLGVNRKNQRAQRFYVKSGFTISGTRTFQLGTDVESDYVMTRELG